MPRNGSGQYSAPTNSWNPAINGVPATAADWQAVLNDIVSALTQSVSRDGQTAMTGNLPMAGNKVTGLGNATATGDALTFAQLFSQGQQQDVPAAATTDIGAQLSTLINVTGAATITSFGTNYNGPRFLRFAGVCTLINSATLVLPGGANITTAAGDSCIAVPLGNPATGWRVARMGDVSTTGDQTIGGIKTFTSQIVASGGVQGDITGNAATVTNGVYTTGAQTLTNKTVVDPILTLGGSEGTAGQVPVSQGAGLPPVWEAVIAKVIRVERTSNTALTAANSGNLIDITSGTFTQTFDACSSLGNGWFCYIRNSGTGDITLDPNASETIDGLTSYIMYPGEVRLVQCDGTALRSVVLNGFYKTFTTSGTFTKPPGYAGFDVQVFGGGGSGAAVVAADAFYASGGGGGGWRRALLNAADVSSSEMVTVGAGGSSVTVSPSTSTNSAAGNPGGNSAFGGHLSVGGGGGGIATGTLGAGASGGTSPASTFLFTNPGGNGGSISSINDPGPGGSAAYAGAGGGSCMGPTNDNYNSAGGTSIYGGAGGGGNNGPYGVSDMSGPLVSQTGGTGTALGGGGGGAKVTANGTARPTSGAGARGELRIWGII